VSIGRLDGVAVALPRARERDDSRKIGLGSMNAGRTSCRRLKRDEDETRRTGRRERGRGGDLGEIHRQGPGPRLSTLRCAATTRCWCWCWPSCHFSLEIGSAQVQCKTCSTSGKEPGPAGAPAGRSTVANRGIPISHKSRGLRSIHYFWAQAPGPGRPWVQQRDLLSTSHWPHGKFQIARGQAKNASGCHFYGRR
jgi:hypothetical protein